MSIEIVRVGGFLRLIIFGASSPGNDKDDETSKRRS